MGFNQHKMSGLWFGRCFIVPSYMECHPNPIDEVHHFSRWAHCTTKQIINDYFGPYNNHWYINTVLTTMVGYCTTNQ